jgi:hypothetical protein
MSPQADYIVANGTGASVRSDLNDQLAAIVSNNSGATEPATMYAYQWWADTTTGLLKLRNSANSAWIELRQLDGEFTTVPVEDGSAGAPSIYFKTSGTDTGLYSPGADQVGISTGGTARVIVDSNGATLNGQGDLRFADSDSSHFIALQAPATITTNVTLTLPSADGTSGQVLSTDGSGTLSFATPAGGASNLADGSAATPSVNYSADTNTGIFRAGNDLLAFSTGGTERAQFDASGRLLVGTSTSTNNMRLNEKLAVVSVGGISGASFTTYQSSTADQPSIIDLQRSRGSSDGLLTVVQSGDTIGSIIFRGSDGSAFQNAARIDAYVDGTPGANDMPGRLVFFTTSDSASSPTERMRITSTGQVRLAGAGITFNGDTATANELDDYEEGTWTPSLGGTATYNYQQGNYTKIGRFVYIRGALSVATLGTGSTTDITGLPFSVGSITGRFGGNVHYFAGTAVNVLNLTVYLNGSTVSFSNISTAGTGTTDGPAIFGNGASVQFSACYQV